ncbi:MAG: EAL domain-containing protein [Kangiellaceae bacterium]|nr:EAL domain-containing protein [Kangiellaceae bacterium]
MITLRCLLIFFSSILLIPISGAEQISIQLKWYHKYQFAGYYAAQMQGYFKDENLEVQLLEGGPHINHQHQLINNQSQYATVGSESVNSLAVGAPFIIVTSIFQHAPEVLITLRSSEILTLEQLRGKKIMLDGAGVAGQIIAMLNSNGLKTDDYQTVDYNGDVLNLANRKVDAMYGYVSNEPFQLIQLGFPVDTFSPRDFGVNFYGDALATTRDELEKNPERVAAVRRAVIRGWNYAIDHSDELIEYILELPTQNPSPYNQSHQRYEADKTSLLIDRVNIPIGNTSADRWAAMFDTFNEFSGGQARFSQSYIYDEFYQDKRLYRQYLFIAGFAVIFIIVLYLWNRTLRFRLNKAISNLDEVAFKDILTGLANRSGMMIYFEQCRAKQRKNLFMAIIDIANLQKINKSQGFQKADLLINKVAKLIEEHADSRDLCYSLYGGKFALVGNAGSRRQFESRINQIVDTVHMVLNNISFHSGGIELDFELDNSTLTTRAELALQHAKSLNAPLLVFFSKLIAENIEKREELYRQVRQAIVYDQFIVFYQPKINSSRSRIEGIEALMRWQHPQKGLLTPQHFLAEVENFPELMELLEDSIIEKIFVNIEQIIHHFGYLEGFRVSINLSSMQFNRASLVEYLLTKCKRFNVEPSHVEFELTESSMLEDLDTAINISKDLQKAGFHVSLDDFGTGYSSLSYIQNLPVNIVKLDYSFVKKIPQDKRSGFVVEHIISLAHKLGLRIVAEGVESKEQLDYLEELEVDFIQGFYFYRPMPVEELLKLPSDILSFE